MDFVTSSKCLRALEQYSQLKAFCVIASHEASCVATTGFSLPQLASQSVDVATDSLGASTKRSLWFVLTESWGGSVHNSAWSSLSELLAAGIFSGMGHKSDSRRDSTVNAYSTTSGHNVRSR